jgi:hypothetical protein
MATLKRGILGGFSGSVANVVGTSWKGIDVMRSKPLSVANPKTAAQETQRGKFSQVVEVASNLLVTIVKPLWDRFAQRQSGYNAFIKANIDNFDQNSLASPATIQIGSGNLQPIENANFTVANADATVNLTWADNAGAGNASGTDQLYFAVYVAEVGAWVGFAAIATRADEAASVELPANLVTGQNIWGYFSFRKADGTAVSNSVSVTKVVG